MLGISAATGSLLEEIKNVLNLPGAAFSGSRRYVGSFDFLDGVTFYQVEPDYWRLTVGTNTFCGYVRAKRDKETTSEQDNDDQGYGNVLLPHKFDYKANSGFVGVSGGSFVETKLEAHRTFRSNRDND